MNRRTLDTNRLRANLRNKALQELARRHRAEFEQLVHAMKHEHDLSHIHVENDHLHPSTKEVSV